MTVDDDDREIAAKEPPPFLKYLEAVGKVVIYVGVLGVAFIAIVAFLVWVAYEIVGFLW